MLSSLSTCPFLGEPLQRKVLQVKRAKKDLKPLLNDPPGRPATTGHAWPGSIHPSNASAWTKPCAGPSSKKKSCFLRIYIYIYMIEGPLGIIS